MDGDMKIAQEMSYPSANQVFSLRHIMPIRKNMSTDLALEA